MRAKGLFLLVVLAWGFGVAGARGAGRTDEATARVVATVAPTIAVSKPVTVIIDLPEDQGSRPIPARLQFSVRVNTPQVELQVACTDLYRAGDPASPYKIPVAGPGVQIACAHGDEIGGGNGFLEWQASPPAGVLPAGWTGAVSEVGAFATSTSHTFSQDVAVEVSWAAAASELPVGEYCGYVELIGLVHP
jgi:hypothetical protein